MDDNGYSKRIIDGAEGLPNGIGINGKDIKLGTDRSDPYGSMRSIMHANKLVSRNDLYNSSSNPLFNKTWRFGIYNPYGTVSKAKEFLFFTKPDLHIYWRDGETGTVTNKINPGLGTGFWEDIVENKQRIIELLQSSYGPNKQDPFNHLLQNMVTSNLEIPSLESELVETATNMYGVNFTYRGTSESSDDGPTFSLEFKDDRWLNVYTYFRAYEEYETAKHHGTVAPYKKYICKKILHDQIAIYKFIVDEDMETILYYGKYFGCMPTSLPRDVFSADSFDQGLTFPITWKAAFYEDMKPEILQDFNSLSRPWYYNSKNKYEIDAYNDLLGRMDGRPATAALVFKQVFKPDAPREGRIVSPGNGIAGQVEETSNPNSAAALSPNKYVYKLKWRGSDVV